MEGGEARERVEGLEGRVSRTLRVVALVSVSAHAIAASRPNEDTIFRDLT